MITVSVAGYHRVRLGHVAGRAQAAGAGRCRRSARARPLSARGGGGCGRVLNN